MELICLGSSSAGNCYVLQAADEALIIECGVDMQEVKKTLGWSLRGVAACLVSHEHKDHAKRVPQMLLNGIPVLALPEVFASCGFSGSPFARAVEPGKGYKAGGFKVLALPVAHDVPCLGYVIEHAEMGKTLFITDTMMCEYRIKGLRHIMIEANYADDILQGNMDAGAVPHTLRDRLMGSHMELGTTLGYLRGCDLTETSDIVLLHLSSGNSDAARFKAEAERVTGLPCHIARKGLRLDFSNMPY